MNVNEEIYSTEETVIGKWIDERPLYRQVVDITTPSTINTPITVGKIDGYPIRFEGYFKSPSGDLVNLFYYGQAARSWIIISETGDIMVGVTSTGNTKLKGYVIVDYIKLTD